MPKMRVYELAKEIGKESKEVLAFLNEKGFEIKSAASNVEEDVVDIVKKGLSSKNSEKENKEPEKKAEPKVEKKPQTASQEEVKKAPSKKKNITAVFNSQYSSSGGNRQRRRPDGDRRAQGERPNNLQGQRNAQNRGFRPEGGHTPIRVRPENERPIRPRVKPQGIPERKAEIDIKPVEEIKTTPVVETEPIKKIEENIVSEAPVKKKEFVNLNPEPLKPAKTELKKSEPVKAPEKSEPSKGARDGGRRKKNDRNETPKKQERTINLEKTKLKKHVKQSEPKTVVRGEDEILTLVLPEHLTIKALCEKMQIAPSEVIKALFMKGTMVTVNQDITYEQAEEIALEFNCICEPEEKVDVIAELLKEEDEDEKDMVTRPPVVCVMGHVDHGKTSLLDAIRKTEVTAKEAGGITQKIGAYMVHAKGQKITFLDTPGHEAFTAMRMRGASSTDIAILVVAADDGVMPQTVEAIDHARAAGVEIIVAINKIDKPGANLDRVKKELSEHDLVSEEWGGSTIFVPVSAKTGEGIEDLLDMVLLTAEVMELKANPKRNARGIVIEAELDKGRGVVATVLVQKGTLSVGDPIAAGKAFGKVRAMIDEHGKRIKKAGPSTPAEILGLSSVPNAGETFMEMDSEKEARSFADTFVSVGKEKMVDESRQRMSLDDLFNQIQAGSLKELNIVVKADVQGSVEAVRTSLEKLSNDEVVVKIIHAGVGAINESDVTLASASNAIIIGFNSKPDPVAKQNADSEGIDIRVYSVIYNIIEDVEAAMKGMLEPVFEEKVIGHAVVRAIFKASDVGTIAGSYVTDGEIKRDCKVRIKRRDDLIFEGDLASLKRFKDNVKEVKTGYECGLVFDGFNEFEVDDEIEAYIMVEKNRA